MVWTDEMRAKAAATRAATKAKKEKRNARSVQGDNGAHSTQPEDVDGRRNGMGRDISESFDWEDAPLSEAINKAAEMKRELDRVSTIILRRRNPPRAMWTCWTQLMKGQIEFPRKVLQECLKRGEDGKWKFRDDGRFVLVDGVRTLQPAFCCNYLCYSVYQAHRVTPKAREVQVQPSI